MPEINDYTVVQVRQVRVTANSAVDAVRIAQAAFENGQNVERGVIRGPDGVWGNTRSRIETVSISAHKE